MKKLILVALLLAACGPKPPTITEDGKYCDWHESRSDISQTSGTCLKDNRVYACMYIRDAKQQVVCGSTCPVVAEQAPKVSQ